MRGELIRVIHDPPQGMVGLAVAAGVEPVAGDFPRRCRDRGDRAQVCPGCLGAGSRCGWSPAAISQQGGVYPGRRRAKASRPGELAGGHQGDDERIQARELAVEELRALAPAPAARPGGRSRQLLSRAGDTVPPAR